MPKADNTVLVVTNPLHFTYYNRSGDRLISIGSKKGIAEKYSQKLGYTKHTSYGVDNNVGSLINAHELNSPEENSYIAWRPVQSGSNLLGASFELASKIENKSYIRTLLPKDFFPEFKVMKSEDTKNSTYEEQVSELGYHSLVFQISDSTGGKGTFMVNSVQDWQEVKDHLIVENQEIVISRYIDGEARGLQCLVLNNKIYSLPWWHKDLVSIEGVINQEVPTATHYCGAVLQNIPDEFVAEVNRLTEEVGKALIKEGYEGIFGIDIVVDNEKGRIYLIEVNARFTAVSHLYATAMHAAGYSNDFITCFVNKLVGGESAHAEETFNTDHKLRNEYYYLKLQNTSNKPMKLTPDCNLGVYDNELSYQRFGFGVDELKADDEIVIIPEVATGLDVLPGSRAMSIIGTGDVVDGFNLTSDVRNVISAVKNKFLV